MIKRYAFGKVFETEAIEIKPEITTDKLPYFKIDENEMSFGYKMPKAAAVYGLGENVRGINKRGWVYESKCTDNPNHQEDTRSLYAAHNFLIIEKDKGAFGVFFDYPGIITFDIGYTKYDDIKIKVSDWNFDVYIIEGSDLKDIVKQYRVLIGKSYVAPLWAFGYGQSRWGYMNENDVRYVVRKHRENNIPLDSVYLDIDYMERYKDFTVNEERFPEFKKFNEEMAEENIHLVPIIDAAVKEEEGYDVYEEGKAKGYFCKKEDGSEFIAAVWPGRSLFPDVLNKEARDWFGDHYKFLLDQGIEGFWNDMNEPSIFYTEDSIAEALDKMDDYKGKNLDLDLFFSLGQVMGGLSQNREDYKKFYHNVNGEKIRHDKVHNLFGYNMTRAAGEAFERHAKDKRILMFSRSSYIGMHRYGGIWQGDNKSWWSHILMNLKMLPSLNMCGYLYTGADLCGFGADTTEDLALRWLALGIFTPLMRNHSCMGTREQEFYQFENVNAFRHIIGLRYKLLPYIYSEYMKASVNNEMMFRPLSFDYPNDSRAKHIEDQLMLGESIMIAPVYEQNAVGRYVYLPEKMKMVRFLMDENKNTVIKESELEEGDYFITVDLDEVVLFVKEGKILPLAEGGQCVKEVDFNNLKLIACPKNGKAEYDYYTDDGYEKDYENPEHIRRIEI